MAWTPKFSARFEEPIVNNVLVIIERDMKDALDHFYPSNDYPDFAERSLGRERGNEFPMLVIAPKDNPIVGDADSESVIEAQRIELHIGVVDDNPDTVTRKIMRYVRALDAVLRTASRADYLTGISGDRPFGFIKEVEHSYDRGIYSVKSGLFRTAMLELTIRFREA